MLCNALWNATDRYIICWFQCKSCRHLCIPDSHLSGYCAFFFIFDHYIILYQLSYLPFIMICIFLNPEFSGIYINFGIIWFLFSVGGFCRCGIYTFMAISIFLCNTMENNRNWLTVWQIWTIKSKTICICIHTGFHSSCFICLSGLLIRYRIIYLLLNAQHFHTLSPISKNQSLWQTDICNVHIFCNGSGSHIIYHDPVSNLLSRLPFIPVCCFINLQMRTVHPYLCHVLAGFLFSGFRIKQIICCRSNNIFPLLTIGILQRLAFKANGNHLSIS